MVLDEELKMMTDICSSDVRAHGPYLIQMSRLAHVGYRIEGTTELPVSEILKCSMFAPTVVGSPLENAMLIITRYETGGRSYYSGFAAMVEDERGPVIDSAILIRTAEIDGKLAIGVGATLVREADPQSETTPGTTQLRARSVRRHAVAFLARDRLAVLAGDARSARPRGIGKEAGSGSRETSPVSASVDIILQPRPGLQAQKTMSGFCRLEIYAIRPSWGRWPCRRRARSPRRPPASAPRFTTQAPRRRVAGVCYVHGQPRRRRPWCRQLLLDSARSDRRVRSVAPPA
ncbi:chorismate-binding protein [Sorangium sp. So ce542]